jgi:hypothetical protein
MLMLCSSRPRASRPPPLCLITPGDLAILVAGTDTASVTSPARPYGMGTGTRPRLAAEPFR